MSNKRIVITAGTLLFLTGAAIGLLGTFGHALLHNEEWP